MRPLPSPSPRIGACLVLASVLVGCMRSGPLETAGIDCGVGALVIIDSSALCVYRAPDIPEMCPEALPNAFDVDGVVICARQSRPAGALLERAAERVAGSDGGIFIVDAAPDPLDGGGRPPVIVDQGGATGGDF